MIPKNMSMEKKLNIIWLILMAITVMNAMIAESASTGVAITILIAVSVSFKGHMVIDHFMALKGANRYLRNLMNAYFYIIPTLIIITYLFPESIARWTSL